MILMRAIDDASNHGLHGRCEFIFLVSNGLFSISVCRNGLVENDGPTEQSENMNVGV